MTKSEVMKTATEIGLDWEVRREAVLLMNTNPQMDEDTAYTLAYEEWIK